MAAAQCVLVTGAGPIGLLAALMGQQRGLDVHVLDRIEDGSEAGDRCRRSAQRTTATWSTNWRSGSRPTS